MARRKKDCTARQCTNRIKAYHYFCESCMSRVPNPLKGFFFDAYKIGDGKKIVELSKAIRDHLDKKPMQNHKQQEQKTMATGQSDIIEISADFRMEKGGGIAIWSGEYQKDSDGSDKLDDQGNLREEWIWLPKSLVQRDGNNLFSMPEWLAKEKKLI